jgi:hypothetical protein
VEWGADRVKQSPKGGRRRDAGKDHLAPAAFCERLPDPQARFQASTPAAVQLTAEEIPTPRDLSESTRARGSFSSDVGDRLWRRLPACSSDAGCNLHGNRKSTEHQRRVSKLVTAARGSSIEPIFDEAGATKRPKNRIGTAGYRTGWRARRKFVTRVECKL